MLTWETEAWGGAEAEPGASLGASPAGENRAGARPVGQALPCGARQRLDTTLLWGRTGPDSPPTVRSSIASLPWGSSADTH